MYNCEILADSLNPQGDRITTMKITFPRIVLSEFNTHRAFSRNSASSRAIPFNKMVKMIEENPFIPIAWQKDHKGMQGSEYWDEEEVEKIKSEWLQARNKAVYQARMLHYAGVTKQLCNRLLEPFMWHTVIVTATSWSNFFELRCPKYYYEPEGKYFKSKKDFSEYWFENFGSGIEEVIEGNPTIWWLEVNKSQADIHIQAIAELMWDAYNESIPKELQPGEWHIPFGDKFDSNKLSEIEDNLNHTDTFKEYIPIMIGTARTARLSYSTLGDNPKIDYVADIKLHDMLLESKHFSPFEHCARAMSDEEYYKFFKGKVEDPEYFNGNGWCNNFRGFIQYRYLIENN